MNKASLLRHEKFRKEVTNMLKEVGAFIFTNDKDTLSLTLPKTCIGSLDLTMFKGDGGRNRPKDELYSLFIRTSPMTDHKQAAAQVNEKFHLAKMNEFSGKWNILHSEACDVINELEDRLKWLCHEA